MIFFKNFENMLESSQNGEKTAKNGNFYTEFAKMDCF